MLSSSRVPGDVHCHSPASVDFDAPDHVRELSKHASQITNEISRNRDLRSARAGIPQDHAHRGPQPQALIQLKIGRQNRSKNPSTKI
jgi:hypothetical protein